MARWITRGRALVASIAIAGFFCTLVLSVYPQLHARLHPDHNRAEHTCAVTLIANGSYDQVVHAPLISAPQRITHLATIAVLTSIWVRPLFLSAHIFAHAPPALS